MSPPHLRVCRVCGIKANTEEELELFAKESKSPHGRRNICKKCRAEYNKRKLRTDKLTYLRSRISSIISRCNNPNEQHYPFYGGRGIKVDEGWVTDRDSFVKWSLANGWKRGLYIDRIDLNGDYTPDNCRWANTYVSNRNRSNRVTDFENLTRICDSCKTEKPIEEFHVDNRMPLGRYYTCKKCISGKRKQRRDMK